MGGFWVPLVNDLHWEWQTPAIIGAITAHPGHFWVTPPNLKNVFASTEALAWHIVLLESNESEFALCMSTPSLFYA